MCDRGRGVYIINSTFCNNKQAEVVLVSTFATSSFEILMDERDSRDTILCTETIHVPDGHKAVLTLKGPSPTDVNLLLQASYTGFCDDEKCEYANDASILLSRHGSVTYYRKIGFFYVTSIKPHSTPSVVFRLVSYPNLLLTGPHMGNAQYLTLPMIDGLHPRDYNGHYLIEVAEHTSVLIKITYFHTHDDYLMVKRVTNGTIKNVIRLLDGDHHYIPVLQFPHSVFIQFCSNAYNPIGGFNLKYITLPSYALPEHVNPYTYNCTVSHFYTFKDIFMCDLIRDCEGYEDEDGCAVYSRSCGGRAVQAGTKCISVLHPDLHVSWSEAQSLCLQRQQRLVQHSQRPDIMTTLGILKSQYNVYLFFVGAQKKKDIFPLHLSSLYRNVWRWIDSSSAFVPIHFSEIQLKFLSLPYCGYLSRVKSNIKVYECFRARPVQLVCEFDQPGEKHSTAEQLDNLSLNNSEGQFWNVEVSLCRLGHVTRDFLHCDTDSQCNANKMMVSCLVKNKYNDMFLCKNGRQSLPYTLLCDHIGHCTDSSDEDFCIYSKCSYNQFECSNHQCLSHSDICDGQMECFDKSDELCSSPPKAQKEEKPFPIIVDIDSTGSVSLTTSHSCPATHFRCVDQFCLPVYLRCNGIADCTDHEDEVACDSYTCQGYYRCRSSAVCLHPDHMCDGVVHCPQYDDELVCRITCPEVCQCQGLVFICTDNFNVSSNPHLRYLDVRGVHTWSQSLESNLYLIRVCLSDTGLTTVPALALLNLQHLDLSHNAITSINMQSFSFLHNLKVLILSANPLWAVSNTKLAVMEFNTLKSRLALYNDGGERTGRSEPLRLDLSHTLLPVFSSNLGFTRLLSLNMSWGRLHTILEDGFKASPQMEVLDLRGSPLKHFPYTLLKTLGSLKSVYSDNQILCCAKMLPPNFDSGSCYTKHDLLASCEDLLKKGVFRVFLWIFSTLSLVGNLSSFIGRIVLSGSQGSFHIFVTALTVADFCMGVYLAIIGTADLTYRGEYLWHADKWKNSMLCQLGGFLSLMSTEVSALIICLITLDRFLVLCFPFSTVHFSRRSALVACASVWIVGVLLAAVPLMPITSHWHFYQQTGICVPLPFVSNEKFGGHSYSFGVMIVFNFVLFVLIALGQFVIYWAVQKNSMSSSRHTGAKDMVIAFRLTTVVMSDFLCWFPVGLLGLLSSSGMSIPSSVSVGVAIFVLPINSALNPFLYTINILMKKRRQLREDRLMKALQESFQTSENESSETLIQCNKDVILRQIDVWLVEKLVSREDVFGCFA